MKLHSGLVLNELQQSFGTLSSSVLRPVTVIKQRACEKCQKPELLKAKMDAHTHRGTPLHACTHSHSHQTETKMLLCLLAIRGALTAAHSFPMRLILRQHTWGWDQCPPVHLSPVQCPVSSVQFSVRYPDRLAFGSFTDERLDAAHNRSSASQPARRERGEGTDSLLYYRHLDNFLYFLFF